MTVDEYIEQLEGWKRDAAQELRKLVLHHCPDAQETIKWGQPTFEYHGPLCYISAFKKHVNLGFPRGAEMDDPYLMLEGTGKNMRHVKIHDVDEARSSALGKLVEQAVAMNENHASQS